jgi:hypothetical protein
MTVNPEDGITMFQRVGQNETEGGVDGFVRETIQIIDTQTGAPVDAEIFDEVTLNRFIETQAEWRFKLGRSLIGDSLHIQRRKYSRFIRPAR